jgi:hypothetical protein
MQKVLLATETKLINIQVISAFLFSFFSCFLNRAVITINPRSEQKNRIEKGGKKPSSILDQM